MKILRRKLLFSIFLISFLILNLFNNNQTQGLATDIVFTSLSTIITPAPRDIKVDEGYLYIADEIDGLLIYDISDKSNPIFETSVPLLNATSVFISGSLAFVTSKDGLSVINIIDPTVPNILSTFVDTNIQNMTEIFVSGNSAYVIDELNGVFSIDLTNLASLSIQDNYASSANAIWFDGFYLYVAQNESITQTTHSTSIVNIDDQIGVILFDVTVKNSFGYVAAGNDGLFIYDLNNFGVISVGDALSESMIDVSVFGSYAFISQDLGPLKVMDVSDKQNLRDISVSFQSVILTNLVHTLVDQNIIYTINSDNEVDIQSWDFQEVVETNTQTVTNTQTLISSITDTTTQNQTITAEETITTTNTLTTVKIFNISITSTFSTYLETVTVTDTYNKTVEYTKSTSSALTDEIQFSSNDDGGSAGIPSFMFPMTITSIILINIIRKKK